MYNIYLFLFIYLFKKHQADVHIDVKFTYFGEKGTKLIKSPVELFIQHWKYLSIESECKDFQAKARMEKKQNTSDKVD